MEKELRNGNEIHFSSDDYDLDASYGQSRPGGAHEFKIWFNGKFVHTSKTFTSFERKLNQLIADYSLERA